MIKSSLRYIVCVLVIVSLSSCGKAPDATSETATGTPAAKAAAMEAQASAPDLSPENAATLKGFIAKSGGQCTEIVGVQGEDLSNKVKVTCTGQAGSADTVSYTVDLETEQVLKDG